MKNICITIRSLAIGGAEKQSLLLAKSLQDFHNVIVVAISDNPKHEKHMEFIQINQIRCYFLKGGVWSKFKHFRALIKKEKIEIIFSYLPGDSIFAGIIGKFSGVKYVYAGLRNAKIDRFKLLPLKFLHNYIVDFSISNSHQGKNEMVEKGFKPEKFIVIPNGMEIKQQAIQRPEKEVITIITVGRFVLQKDYNTALQSIAYLKNELLIDQTIKYIIVGYGELEEKIRNWIIEYDLTNEVEVHLNTTQIGNLYKAADIYLCSSIFEGLSNTILEAMEYSLPIVATDVGDNAKLVEPDKNGFLIQPGSYITMAGRLFDLVMSHEKRIQFGLSSFDKVIGEFSIQALRQNYLNLINKP